MYDIVIVGAGPGGYVAAIKAAHMGAKVALIEKENIGGVCLNIGCIPTKSFVKSASVYKTITEAKNFGIDVDLNSVKINWPQVINQKDKTVSRLTTGIKTLIEKNGIDLYIGEAEIQSANLVRVNNQELQTKNVIIATGATPIIPPITGAKEAYDNNILLSSKEILSVEEIPQSLVIVGGGVIGIEFASIFSTFGTKVTIIEREDKILVPVDDDIRTVYNRQLRKARVKVLTNSSVTEINNNVVYYENDGKVESIETDKILMSVGMKANIDGLQHLNLELENRAIKVNEKMETSVKGIYAIGDCNGKMMLAHVASAEGIIAVSNILGEEKKINYNLVPSGIYTFPEMAWVGINEQQAIHQGLDYTAEKFPLQASGKALVEGQTDGFIKIIFDNKTKEILGVHIIGPNATELIAEAVVIMELEGTIFDLTSSIHPHPTLSESVMEAAFKAIGHPIHTL